MNATPEEMVEARRWVAAWFESVEAATLPFSFTYGGQPSADALKTWRRQWTSRKLDDQRQEHTLTFTDPKTELVVRCVIVEYLDFPIVEWTLYFGNSGSVNTPILSDIQALDTYLAQRNQGGFVLHHHTGSPCTVSDYRPFKTPLDPKTKKRITAAGGRPTNSDLPCFNIEGDGQGLIVVVGWPGQWVAEFERDEGDQLRVRAGQELTHLKLHPGEEIRSPLIVLQFWKGDRIRSQNIWRRWMIAHNLPKPGGKLPGPQMAGCSGNHFPHLLCNETDEMAFIDKYLAEGIYLDYWWMDAGWYINNGTWVNTGTWEVDAKRFPRGLRAVSDHAHAKGVKIIVWFEPERVTPGTWLYENHPEWLLGLDGQQKLLNLGDPGARQWLTEHIDKLLVEQGIDLYRQDFNMDPLDYWRANDAEDRQGITEIYHVMGYLAYWDELRRRHPNMLIDSCASGGRRNDLETLRRAVPLLRSDYTFVPLSDQCQTYGLAFWVPYYGTGMLHTDPKELSYYFRSQMCPHFTAGWDVRLRDLDFALIRLLVGEWRKLVHCYLGDYYPLTSYSLESDVWMAWQFNCPEEGQGLVQIFRRAESPYESACFRLCGLDPDSRYTITDLDAHRPQQMTGRELMDQGLSVTIASRPAAVVVVYEKAG